MPRDTIRGTRARRRIGAGMSMSTVADAPGTHPPPGSAVHLPPASDWRLQAAIVFGLELAHLSFESVRTDHALLFDSVRTWLAYKGDEVLRQFSHVVVHGRSGGVRRGRGRAAPVRCR